jgi:sugar/nucleoside kinase (ribokinase family)
VEPEIDRAQVVQYAIRSVIAACVFAGTIAVSLYLGHDMDTASRWATIVGGGVLALLSHGTALWAQSPKKGPPLVVNNFASLAPPPLPVIPVDQEPPHDP